MEPKVPSIIAQLNQERDRVGKEIAEIDERIKERETAVAELARIEAAIAALSGSGVERIGKLLKLDEHRNGNGNGGDAATSIDPDGSLGRVVKFLRGKKTPVAAKSIHKRVAPKGSHEALTYGVLKRAVERGIVTRTGTNGKYRFELAR